jgi:16S rRNA (cytosine1402-N4)-methyltransferase
MKPPTSTSSSSPPSALSAGDIVNTWEVGALSNVLRAYGEEPRAYKIARAIVSSRPLKSTTELREVVAKCAPYAGMG